MENAAKNTLSETEINELYKKYARKIDKKERREELALKRAIESIYISLKKVFSKGKCADAKEVMYSFLKSDMLDSLDCVEVVMGIEDYLQITINDEHANNITAAFQEGRYASAANIVASYLKQTIK